MLGTLYRDGGILIPDSTLAAEAFEKAAQAGMVPAQCALGELLLSDDLDVLNPPAGLEWLKRAWEGGSLRAGYLLAKEYLSGENAAKDVEHGNACLPVPTKATPAHSICWASCTSQVRRSRRTWSKPNTGYPRRRPRVTNTQVFCSSERRNPQWPERRWP